MAHSTRLKLCVVRAVFRLLGEVRELGADPRVWRRHMIEQLSRVTGTMIGIASEPSPASLYSGGSIRSADRSNWRTSERRRTRDRAVGSSPRARNTSTSVTIPITVE